MLFRKDMRDLLENDEFNSIALDLSMKQRLLFLGPPGAGKGTQAELLCKKYGLFHMSTGDLLRAEVGAGTPLGKAAALVMNRGELVSDQIVLSIVENRLTAKLNGWLLDGFPRNLDQAKGLEELLEKLQQPIDLVVSIELSDEILVERLLLRGRQDDNEEVIRNRLDIYREKTAPLIDYYRSLGILQTIQGDGKIEDVAERISCVFE